MASDNKSKVKQVSEMEQSFPRLQRNPVTEDFMQNVTSKIQELNSAIRDKHWEDLSTKVEETSQYICQCPSDIMDPQFSGEFQKFAKVVQAESQSPSQKKQKSWKKTLRDFQEKWVELCATWADQSQPAAAAEEPDPAEFGSTQFRPSQETTKPKARKQSRSVASVLKDNDLSTNAASGVAKADVSVPKKQNIHCTPNGHGISQMDPGCEESGEQNLGAIVETELDLMIATGENAQNRQESEVNSLNQSETGKSLVSECEDCCEYISLMTDALNYKRWEHLRKLARLASKYTSKCSTAVMQFSIPFKHIELQIVEGLQSLHEGPRPILHRDLCPANVVLNAKLCVKLTGFGNSNILQKEVPIQDYNEGTPCWKAKESLCYSTCSKESDIQATGMLVYFVLSGGLHPYGELDQPHIVEENIKMGQPTGLPLIDDQEARDMIEWMLEDNSAYRPDVNQILNHPFLEQWNNGKRMEFLERVGNQPEVASGKDNSSTLWAINNKCNKTCTCVGDWKNKVDEKLLTESTRPYNQSVGDLLRLIRNVRQHYQELSEELQELVDDKYFLRLFPSLVVHIYKILRKRALADGSWAKRKSLQRYFIPKS
uniref:Protein kinase domain-containing protein n=1 Tax=Branchiostoma floridae TaxID=7739 RepID=C3ZAH9_BRAFL|eukprot:XP_002594371.1 hypothetical protein BRAFLDRAFT_72220 [Branchiostoma floridae]